MKTIQNKRGIDLHFHALLASPQAPTILFCCTPVVPAVTLQACYLPLHKKGFNVFALNFTGMAGGGGTAADFTADGILDDFDSLLAYIKNTTSGNVYLFADAGIGGIIGQYYMGSKPHIQGFAQFAVGIYCNTSALGIPTPLARVCLPLVKLLCTLTPNLRLTMKPPKYTGYHAEEDNAFYAAHLAENKDFFRVPIHFARVLLELFVNKNSHLQQTPLAPTLVFKTTHDRYFPPSYFDDYFSLLQCPKQLHVVADVHNSYALYPDLFATTVASWFLSLD